MGHLAGGAGCGERGVVLVQMGYMMGGLILRVELGGAPLRPQSVCKLSRSQRSRKGPVSWFAGELALWTCLS